LLPIGSNKFLKFSELKRQLEVEQAAFSQLNESHYNFKEDVEIQKDYAKEDCKKMKLVTPPGLPKIAVCQASLVAKNNSLNSLREKYLVQSTQLGNVTSMLRTCHHDLEKSTEEVNECNERSDSSSRDCDQKLSGQKKVHDETVRGQRRVVVGLQHHLQCLETEENCRDVAGFYVCMPKEMAEAACLLHDIVGQQLFGIKTCALLGDPTLAQFSFKQFMSENPKTASLMILPFVLAAVGLLTILTTITWILVRYRLQLCRGLGCLFAWLRRLCIPRSVSGDVELPPIVKGNNPEKKNGEGKKESEEKKGEKKGASNVDEAGSTNSGGSTEQSTSGIPEVPPMKSEELNKIWKVGEAEAAAAAAAAKVAADTAANSQTVN
jgi:hypothetical protein